MVLLASATATFAFGARRDGGWDYDDLPLAVLRALVEALRINAAQRDTPAHVPLIGPTSAISVCCDNFI